MGDSGGKNNNEGVTSSSPPTTATTITNDVDVDDDIDLIIESPSVTTHQVLQCQFANWYPTFANIQNQEEDSNTTTKLKRRKKVTIQSTILGADSSDDGNDKSSLPSDFKDYILSDGVQLPIGATRTATAATSNQDSDDDWSDDDDDDDKYSDNNNDNNDPSAKIKQFHFPQLNEQIRDAISTLGGAVMPKLNWSSPKDAVWVNGGSLKCTNPGDVYILIKSSDFCLHDILGNSLKECEDYNNTNTNNDNPLPPLQLVLRKWCNLNPSMEFRCFIRDHELLAISQRNHTQHYPHLVHDLSHTREQLLDFYEDYIHKRFANGTISNYVVDVYLDQQDRAWILDFNIFGRSTDSLLFDWSELMTMDHDDNDPEDDPIFRIVETANQVRADPLASYRAPIDTVDLATMMQGDAKQFEEFMKQCQIKEEDGEKC